MRYIIILIAIFLMASVCSASGSTWKQDLSAFNYGHNLPELGLLPPTPGMKFSYNMKETGVPDRWDWRSTPNGSMMTSVKDQGGCGACVAYAIVGQIESQSKIAALPTKILPDLAEMEFFKGSCDNGWNFDRAYPVAKSPGIMSQKCYDSGTCKDRTAIKGWSTTRTPKTALLNGPIVTGCAWDFNWFYYDGGIINDASGGLAGYHALCIVGYNDPGQYWIVRNSWGSNWGESGYFRIDYNTATEAGFGIDFPWYVVDMGSAPGPNPEPSNIVKDFDLWSTSTLIMQIKTVSPNVAEFWMVLPEKRLLWNATAPKTVMVGKYTASMKNKINFVFVLKDKAGIFWYGSDKAANTDNQKHAMIWPSYIPFGQNMRWQIDPKKWNTYDMTATIELKRS